MTSISVIIPTYNSEKYILSTLDSVYKQTVLPYEIIIVDDCSSDNTVNIVNEYFEKHAHHCMSQSIILMDRNSGPSKARNTGLKIARGEWVSFLDADDIWHKCKIEFLSTLMNDKTVYFIGHTYNVTTYSPKNINSFKVEEVSFLNLLLRNIYQTSCVSFRLDKQFLFDEQMKYCEDYDLWLRLLSQRRGIHVNFELTTLGRPQHSVGGLSSNIHRMRLGEINAYFHVCKINIYLYALLPVLLIASIAKHIKLVLKRFLCTR